ncbi:glycosyltransferase family 2 protein [Cyanobium sp. Morenito 9A2]|uniref:glycosyltransferase n=1 Tax=Cyanobium sp. Morenito 9A2 TaxID=2823718 RepID=UPI0020CE1625|nr:glycosyltransferase family 2 protein [Cyanobium sp. Morenito 9A2]MCP9850263.1 glycosyltransferase family 2 protein [Cyanobium sp. Morenito 9A2]
MAANGSTGTDRRRLKASLFLLACGAAGIAPHGLEGWRSLVPALSLTLLLGLHSLRTLVLAALRRRAETDGAPATTNPDVEVAVPLVDVVVAARDEEAVIGRLVERIAQLRYPAGQLLLWIVDDGSSDRTPELLDGLRLQHPFLRLVRRSREAGGGKSGALNTVLSQLEGRWMLVLDADAQLQSDVLERLIPFAEQGGWSAVQLRKAVVNAEVNLLTQAQAMEMALDAVIQQGRLDGGGIAELRGNGQLLLRAEIQACGGFNEATVTDDLDLSFRLLLAGRSIGVLWDPPVQEEAVLSFGALWRQRQRWAEGGLQRFFDYWPGLLSERVSLPRKLDLSSFFLLQYGLPVVAVADLATSVLTRTWPVIWPLSLVALGLSGVAMLQGCRRPSEGPALPEANPITLALGIGYLIHWFVVIPWVSVRMALLPKRLIWAKTLHLGSLPESDLSTQAS